MIAVIAKLKIKEGKVDEVIQLFHGMVPHIRMEEGTLFYTVNRDSAEPNTLVVLERYREGNDLHFHSKTPHFLEFSPKVGALLEGDLEINILEEVLSV